MIDNKVREKPTTLGEKQLVKLRGYVAAGHIPPVYKNLWEFFCDFYPDLNWDGGPGFKADIETILEATDFPKIKQFFQEKYNFDFEKELRDAWAGIENTDYGSRALPQYKNPLI